ncbi:MAG: amino acid adenylation domain-containing protein [Rhizobacter sp.]
MELLIQLREKNIELSLKGDELILRGKEQVLDAPALLAQLRERKQDLVALIRSGRYVGPDGLVQVPPNGIPAGAATITPAMLPLVELTQGDIDRVVEGVPGGAPNVQDIYPLAPLQEGIFFHHLVAGRGDPYLLQVPGSFATRPELDAYLHALGQVVARHDVLRTSVPWEGLPQPLQVVWREAPLPVEEVSVDPAAGDALAQLQARFDPRRFRIDLRRAPLVRVFVAEDRAQSRWVALALYHHLVMEGSAVTLIQQEIDTLLAGESHRLRAPLPYRNFVAQSRLGMPAQEHEAFFRRMLGDVDEPTLPFGLHDVHGDGGAVAQATRAVDAALGHRLRRQARAAGVSLASLCHLAWAAVLARVSGRDDVVFGTVLFGRMRGADSAPSLGSFANTLPVRVRLGAGGVREAAREVHTLLATLRHHEHASLSLAQRCSDVAAPTPLFSALLNYRHVQGLGGSAPIGAAPDTQITQQRTNYPLALQVDDLGDDAGGLRLDLQLGEEGDAEALVDCVLSALQRIAEALERAPQQPMADLDVLPVPLRERLVNGWNTTTAPYPHERFVHDLIGAQAAATPDATALVCDGQVLGHAELDSRANRLAHHLRTLGVGPDVRVALCFERSFEMVVGLLAVLKAGGAYVPLDPGHPDERLAQMLLDSAPVAVLTHDRVDARVHASLRLALQPAGTPLIDVEADAARWRRQPADAPAPLSLTPQHLAYVIYTSGSTGVPKGVMVTHGGLCNYLWWAAQAYEPTRSVVSSSLSFDATVTSLLVPLLRGGSVHLLSEQRELDELHDLLVSGWQGLVKITPAHLEVLGQRVRAGARRTSVQVFVVGGEALPAATVALWREIQPGVRIVNEYGPTETVVGCVVEDVGEVAVADAVAIGRPIANTRIYLLDGRGRPVPPGVAAELCIAGAGVARGYLNQPALSDERFVPDPFATEAGARMYRTGDLGRHRNDGTIDYIGRNDFQLKVRGYRIEPGEIEAQLLQFDGVREAVVIARENPSGDKRLVAYVVMTGPLDEAALAAHLARTLPPHMMPTAFVTLDALPLTANGKLDRRALPAPGTAGRGDRAGEAPSGDTEITLATIWADVLQVAQVGRQDDFFSLGGHSLLAVKAVSRLRQAFGVEVGVTELFAHPVLADFARAVEQARPDVLPPIDLVPRDDRLPLSFAQSRLWFLSQLQGLGEAYHLPLALRLVGPLDRAALRRALDGLVARHESLRTTFAAIDGEPFQRIAPADAGFVLREVELQGDTELERIAGDEVSAPFDLATGPLIRGCLATLGPDDHALMVTMHHIVSDGWSMGVLSGELSRLYRAFSEGLNDTLPPLAVQYADYAAWQRRSVGSDTLKRQTEYWARTLADAPPLLALPTDRPRPPQQEHDGALVAVEVDEALASSLKALGQRCGTTLFMTLMAAWASLLGRLARQDDVVIGTPVANRGHAELEPLIGFFVNTLALRVDLSGDPSVLALLQRVKAQSLDAQRHQDLAFEQVVEVAKPQRSLSHSPLFQVMFVWQNNEAGELDLPGLQVEGLASPYRVTKFDLALNLGESGGQIGGVIEYATALFDRSSIERLAQAFGQLLRAMVAAPEAPVASLSLLSTAERERQLVGWNPTEPVRPSADHVHRLIEARAAQAPDGVAVEQDGRTISYGELDRRANQLARHLLTLGAVPDSRIAVCTERCPEMVIAILAVLKAGAAYVPMDPSHPAARRARMLQDSGALVVLGTSPVETGDVPFIDLRTLPPAWQQLPGDALEAQADSRGAFDLAYVIYTSGSTGVPKGAMVEHGSVCHHVGTMAQAYSVQPGDRVLQFVSVAFDVCAEDVLFTLAAGATLVLRTDDWITSADGFWARCAEQDVNCVSLSALFWEQLALDTTRPIPPCVRRTTMGGEVVSDAALHAWFTREGHRPRLFNAYGPTEATVCATLREVEPDDARVGNRVIGRPLAHARAYVLDAHGQPVPTGTPGELAIGGAGVGRGYLNEPVLSRERFVADPFVPAPGRMYLTGDLVRHLPDGQLQFIGRADDQLKVRGFRVEPREIEAALVEHPGVAEAVVLASEDAAGSMHLCAHYLQSGGDLGSTVLQAHLSQRLPDYMVPGAFVAHAAWPLTPNGKLDRRALAEAGVQQASSRAYEAPEGETESLLAAMWAQLLQREPIGRHDDFFELGGHSLLMTRLISRIEDRFGVLIALQDVFRQPVLSGLAVVVLQAQLAQFSADDLDTLVGGD